MKKTTILMTVALFVLALAAVAVAGEKAEDQAKAPTSFDQPQPVGTVATCPVMGGTFKITKDTPHSEVEGKHVYFCCPGCKPQFDADPTKFIKSEK